jgi:hypothetical protein
VRRGRVRGIRAVIGTGEKGGDRGEGDRGRLKGGRGAKRTGDTAVTEKAEKRKRGWGRIVGEEKEEGGKRSARRGREDGRFGGAAGEHKGGC